MLHNKEIKILGATIWNSVALVTWCLGYTPALY